MATACPPRPRVRKINSILIRNIPENITVPQLRSAILKKLDNVPGVEIERIKPFSVARKHKNGELRCAELHFAHAFNDKLMLTILEVLATNPHINGVIASYEQYYAY